MVQMSILDGNAYDNKCLETGQEQEDDLDACSLLLNNKVQQNCPRSALACTFGLESVNGWMQALQANAASIFSDNLCQLLSV